MPSGCYFARVRYGRRLHRKSLETEDQQLAKRKLADFRRELESTDPRSGNTSFGAALDTYEKTLRGAPGTKVNKRMILDEDSRTTWFETKDSAKRIHDSSAPHQAERR